MLEDCIGFILNDDLEIIIVYQCAFSSVFKLSQIKKEKSKKALTPNRKNNKEYWAEWRMIVVYQVIPTMF